MEEGSRDESIAVEETVNIERPDYFLNSSLLNFGPFRVIRGETIDGVSFGAIHLERVDDTLDSIKFCAQLQMICLLP
jgi:hypothetical protein